MEGRDEIQCVSDHSKVMQDKYVDSLRLWTSRGGFARLPGFSEYIARYCPNFEGGSEGANSSARCAGYYVCLLVQLI